MADPLTFIETENNVLHLLKAQLQRHGNFDIEVRQGAFSGTVGFRKSQVVHAACASIAGNGALLTLAAARKIRRSEVWQNITLVTVGFILLMIVVSESIFVKQGAVWMVGLILAYVLYFQFYHLLGQDSLEASQAQMIVRVGLGPFNRRFKYQAERLTNLRCENTIYQRSRSFGGLGGRGSTTVWESVVDSETSMIVCDYDGQEKPLIGSINKALAQHFVSKIKQRFPNYR